MGTWQRRVAQQICEEEYADKTAEQMQEILEQYKKNIRMNLTEGMLALFRRNTQQFSRD